MSSQGTRDGTANYLLIGAAVYAVDPRRPPVEALAVRGDRIVAVGSSEQARAWKGPRTEVLSLPGRAVLPGFQDAHVHPPWAGVERRRCSLDGLAGREEYRDAISAYASAHPDEPWVLGGGWAMPAFPGGTPRRDDLDDIVPDRPAFLVNRDGHGAWVNGRALEMAGIGRGSSDPPDGRIERDPVTGEPSGTLHEGAMNLVERLLPETRGEDWEAGILEAQSYLHSLGITAWQDAWVSADMLHAYRSLAERGELTARVRAALWWERRRGEEQVQELLERREWGTVGNLRADAVKIMLDGVCENFTASMLEPYLDREGRETGNHGLRFVDPEMLSVVVPRLDREGFQVHFHAIGDRAVRDGLDAVEAAIRANGRRDARHHIAHLQVVHPDDLPRFAKLGVVANAQTLWGCLEPQMTELTLPFIGEKRARNQYPWRSLLDSGARLACGSDWSVSTPNPFLQMEVAARRIAPGNREGEPLIPEERIGLPEALEAFTRGSAFVNHLDGETGSLEAGKLADLVVVDRDVLAPDAGPVGDAQVLLTMVGGRVVFEAKGLG